MESHLDTEVAYHANRKVGQDCQMYRSIFIDTFGSSSTVWEVGRLATAVLTGMSAHYLC